MYSNVKTVNYNIFVNFKNRTITKFPEVTMIKTYEFQLCVRIWRLDRRVEVNSNGTVRHQE